MNRWSAVVRVLFTSSITRPRLLGLGALGLVAIVVGFVAGQSDTLASTTAATDLVNVYGLSVLAPVVTLVLASAVLGDPVEDNTLAYLWLRPVPRWLLAFAAVTAAVGAAVPVVVVPLVLGALATGADPSVALGAAVAATAAVVGYTGIFVPLGLIARRALTWGIVYILIWEGFVARAGASSSRWSVQYYARSLFAEVAEVSVRLADAATVTATVMPVVVLAAGMVLTTARLQRMSVA